MNMWMLQVLMPLTFGEHHGNGVVVHVDNGRRGDDPRGIVAGKVMEVGCLARGYPIWRS